MVRSEGRRPRRWVQEKEEEMKKELETLQGLKMSMKRMFKEASKIIDEDELDDAWELFLEWLTKQGIPLSETAKEIQEEVAQAQEGG